MSEPVASTGAHSWGCSDDSYQPDSDDKNIVFVDDPEGLRVAMIQYPGHFDDRGHKVRVEMDHTIPIELVPSLIRRLVRFASEGEIGQTATRRGFKGTTA